MLIKSVYQILTFWVILNHIFYLISKQFQGKVYSFHKKLNILVCDDPIRLLSLKHDRSRQILYIFLGGYTAQDKI